MMYSNALAIAIKVNGKVLREFKDTAFIPFGSEYSILIKNLNTVRVQVRVEVDGADATDGVDLVILPKSEMELKRFIKNGNLNQGNAFKFIERTPGVEQHRGVGVEDGLIRIEYQFERPQPVYYPPFIPPTPARWTKTEYWEYGHEDRYGGNNILRGRLGSQLIGDQAFYSTTAASPMNAVAAVATSSKLSTSANASEPMLMAMAPATASSAYEAPVNDAGITVPGQVVDQAFSIAASFPVEATKHVMIVKLLGETNEGQVVKKAITVKHKPKCISCGHLNKHNAKFCTECGTSLTLV